VAVSLAIASFSFAISAAVVVAGAADVAGAAAVVDGAGTDAGGLGGSSADWVGVIRPDITHHTANPSAAIAITLSKSMSIGGPSTTLSTQPDIATKVPRKFMHNFS
jgi:hypothetical protein